MKRSTRKLVSLVMIVAMTLSMTVGQSAFAASKLGKVKGIKATTSVKKKTIKLSWKKVKGASGYSIQKNTKKKFKKIKAVTVKKRQKTFKKLKVGKTYYFRLRAFKKTKSGKKYGKATIKKVRLETTPKTLPHTVACPICSAREEFEKTLEGFTLKIANPYPAPALDSSRYELTTFVEQSIEEMFGITIEQTYSFENYDTAMTASLASGNPQAHIYQCKTSKFTDFFDKNYLCDLTDAMKKSNVNFNSSFYNAEVTDFLNINDKQVGWSVAQNDPQVIFYNKDLVEQANLTDPKELVEGGRWTWGDLVEYCYAMSSALVVENNDASALFKGMVASCGSSLTKVLTYNSPTTNMNDAAVKESLTLMKHWVDTGYVSLDAQPAEDFVAGKAAMYYGKKGALSNVSAQFDIGVVPFPKRNQSQSRFFSFNNTEYVCFIPSTFKQDAAKILYLYNEMGLQYSRYERMEFVLETNSRVKGDDMDMLFNISFGTRKYVIANDFSSFCEIAPAATDAIVDSVLGGTLAQDAVDAHIADLESAHKSAWGDKKITG